MILSLNNKSNEGKTISSTSEGRCMMCSLCVCVLNHRDLLALMRDGPPLWSLLSPFTPSELKGAGFEAGYRYVYTRNRWLYNISMFLFLWKRGVASPFHSTSWPRKRRGFYYLPSQWRTTGLPVTYFSGHVYVTLFSCFCNIVPIFRHFYVLFCDSFVIFLHFSWLFCWFAVTFLPAHKTAILSLNILTWLLLFSSLCFVFDQNISYFISQMHAVSYYQAYMFTCPLCFSSLFMYIS